MRIISLDTETTGLYPEKGDRITEIACVEIVNRQITQNIFHTYINPEKEVSKDAKTLTGLELNFLKDKPKFKNIVDDLIKFINGCDKIIIHNAEFDVNFINTELKNINHKIKNIENTFNIFDTLKFARTVHPGKKNSIDALCNRFKIKHDRKLHGALIDAKLLAKIYLKLTTGQSSININNENIKNIKKIQKKVNIIKASEKEINIHNKYISMIRKNKI